MPNSRSTEGSIREPVIVLGLAFKEDCPDIRNSRVVDVIHDLVEDPHLADGSHLGQLIQRVADRERGVLIGATLVTPRAGEIVGELVLAIKLGTPLKTLADVIHPFPAFNRMLGQTLEELAAKVAGKGEHHEQYARQH